MRRGIIIRSLIAVLSVSILLSSCGEKGKLSKNKGSNHKSSRTTGWNYNDETNGGFHVSDLRDEVVGPGLVPIQGGTFTMGSTMESVYYEWNNAPRKVTVSSFYMDETEVSNLDYLEYIYWLKRVYADYPDVVANALPDTLVWRNYMSYNEPMIEIYFRHPSYRDYPVVGVSWKQANDYALWRSDRVNERLLIEAGVLSYNNNQDKDNHFTTDAYLTGQYTGTSNGSQAYANGVGQRKAQVEDGILLPKYRLPTEAEWEYAALGLTGNTNNGNITKHKVYPWNSYNSGLLRNGDAKDRGKFMANFRRGSGDYMGIAGDLNDGDALPAPVKSYWANDYGLYNMAGNVSEWVLDVYRPLSFEDVNDHNPFRGNIYNTELFSNNIEMNDSIKKMREDAYNLNFNDGDYTSTIQEGNDWISGIESPEKYTNQMYDYGNTTLISDKSRVYKGGSWADGPYYLSPSTRRFMNEDESSSTVGFRCAMTKIGRH